jgi:hypothetical protein
MHTALLLSLLKCASSTSTHTHTHTQHAYSSALACAECASSPSTHTRILCVCSRYIFYTCFDLIACIRSAVGNGYKLSRIFSFFSNGYKLSRIFSFFSNGYKLSRIFPFFLTSDKFFLHVVLPLSVLNWRIVVHTVKCMIMYAYMHV